MTGPSHHPTDHHLLAYASGALGEVKALLVATHLAYCPACRRRAAAFEETCGRWLDELPAADLAEGGLDAVLARLDAAPRPPRRAAPAPRHDPAIPEPLRGRLGGPLAGFAWTPVSPGVDLSQWSVARDGTSVCLLRMAAGRPVPPHRHSDEEMLLVLEGAFADEYGRFRVGDVAVYAADTDHHAVADPDGPCLCLFLLDGPIEFLEG
ncbi:ChrR family anti-sigma-E factor [Azospirillum sp. ST 5-10]|uniref:ChrR family anti-sigma-E factor n=1 Tax=unclassified Azospirillum TaxID=2630922 RepID=UPI003F4A5C68